MFKIKSVEHANIIINGKNLTYGDTMKVDKDTLENISKLIESGMIVVEPLTVDRVEEQIIILSVDQIKDMNQKIKSFIEIFYKFHMNLSLSEDELSQLSWFYKNVSPISELPKSVIDELDDIKNQEELIEVLVNQIYPSLLEKFYKKPSSL